MYRNDYLEENDLDYMYENHTGKFINYIEEQGLGNRINDITPDILGDSVSYYCKQEDINTITSLDNYLNSIKNFYDYLFKKGKSNNIFQQIKDYNEYKNNLIEQNNLREKISRGYLDNEDLRLILEYFNSNPTKYKNTKMMEFFIKITLLLPRKKNVISNLKVGDFDEKFRVINIDKMHISLPRALSIDINNEIKKLNKKINDNMLFFELFFSGEKYNATIFNSNFYPILNNIGYNVSNQKSRTFSVEVIRNTAIVNLYLNKTDILLISKIANLKVEGIINIVKDIYEENSELSNNRINEEIARCKFYPYI